MRMMSEMDFDGVVQYFRGKSILITGSTGFIGKVLVEKILRVQPDVKKLFLLIRASDIESAKHRIQSEVIGLEIFQVLKEKHGLGFDNFVDEKICPLVGDIMYENFGLDIPTLKELSNNIDIIVNGAATTNFFERYDVAFDVNVLGAKYACAISKKFANLKMLLHISTAYVAGEQEGKIQEKSFLLGETLRVGTHLDIQSEINLIKETRRELRANCSTEKAERKTMKELGLKRARHFGWPNTYVFTKALGEMILGKHRGDLSVVILRPSIITSTLKEPFPGWIEGIRTIDSVIISYAKQNLPFFLVDLDLIVDVIPADMVVNSMMVAMAAHSEDQHEQIIYHVTSSVRNPSPGSVIVESMYRYFFNNPLCKGINGEHIPFKKIRFFRTLTRLKLYTTIKYELPLKLFHLVNIALCGVFSRHYIELSRKYGFLMKLIKLYAPYTSFKGCFDDLNLERLRRIIKRDQNNNGAYNLDFDPTSIDWNDYFYSVHIPGLLKYMHD